VLLRCYVVDDQAAIVISIDRANLDLDSMPLKVKEPRAFRTLLRNGMFVERRRTNGVDRCLVGRQNSRNFSHVQVQ